jgi:hypothetical protein
LSLIKSSSSHLSFTPSPTLINRINRGYTPLSTIFPVNLFLKYTNFLQKHNLIYLDQITDATGQSLIYKSDLFLRNFNHHSSCMSNSRFFVHLEAIVLENSNNRLLKSDFRLDHPLPIYKHLAVTSFPVNNRKEFIASWNPILNAISF